MTAHPITTVLVDTVPVDKSAERSYQETRVRLRVADAAEVQSTDLSLAFGVDIAGQTWDKDTSDTTTADDGVQCIIDAVGNRFKIQNSIPYFIALAADQTGQNVTGAQTWFPGGGATVFNLPANSSWEFEGALYLARSAGTTSHTISVLFGGTATVEGINFEAESTQSTGNALNAKNAVRADSAAGAIVTNATTVATGNAIIRVRGIVRIGASGGTFIPEFSYSAAPGGAPTIKANSFFLCGLIGTDAVLSRLPPLPPLPAWCNNYLIGATYPVAFADTTTEGTTNYYLYNGAICGSFAAWLSAAGGTFARSSSAYYTNASGVLTSAAAGVPRFDYDPVALTPKGLLREGASTNLFLQSQFASGWTSGQGTLTPNSAIAPDGTMTAVLAVPNTTNTYHQVDQSVTTSTPVVISGYVKAAGYTHVWISCNNVTGVVAFNLSTGVLECTAASGGFAAAGIQYVGNGWYRIWAYVTSAGSIGATGFFPCNAALTNGNAPFTFAGDGSSGIYLWGVQVEVASFPSSYIPTTTTSATRAADSLYLPWTATTFTARVKATLANYISGNVLIDTGNGLLTEAAGPDVQTSNGTQTLTTSVAAFTQSNIIVVAGSPAGRVLSANGNAATSDSNALVPSAPTDFYIGQNASGANQANGNYPQIGLWTIAATATQAATNSGTS